jgi:hypothetical protein
VTGFSVYSSVIDWANKLNYELDEWSSASSSARPVAIWAWPTASSPARSG